MSEENPKKLIIPIGPAGCGKSTFYNNRYDKFTKVSPDEVRYVLYNYNKGFREEFENQVWQTVWDFFIVSLQNKENIYLDATNLTRKRRLPFIYVARSFNYEISMVLFEKSINKILQQNNARERKVLEKEIFRQFLSLEYPNENEYDFCYDSDSLEVW